MPSQFADLVEKCAREVAEADTPGLWDHMCEREPFPRFWEGTMITRDDCRKTARAILAEVYRTLETVTPEMCAKGDAVNVMRGEAARRIWLAMLHASALNREGK